MVRFGVFYLWFCGFVGFVIGFCRGCDVFMVCM
jgi:hypothetical protein